MPATPFDDTSLDAGFARQRYPNPFFDLSREYLPKNIKTLFKYCKYFFYTNGFIRNVVTKLTEYPITDLLYDKNLDPDIKDRYDELFNHHLGLKKHLIEIGLDYYTYGNCFISLNTKFKRFLSCSNCGHHNPIETAKYQFKKYTFQGECPNCLHYNDDYKVEDIPVRSPEGLNFIRWDPSSIDIVFDELTHQARYYYAISPKRKKAIAAGKKDLLASTPLIFIQSLKQRKKIELDKNNLFHFKRPALAEDDMGWGKPALLPAMKDLYYMQTLRRGNEAVANEHIVPKKAIYPASQGAVDPYCVAPFTPLLVKDSITKKIALKFAEDVALGDELTNKEGEWSEVAAKMIRPVDDEEKVFNITLQGNAFSQTMSEKHPVWVSEHAEDNGKWVFAGDIKKDAYIGYTVKSFGEKNVVDLAEYVDYGQVTKNYIFLGFLITKERAEVLDVILSKYGGDFKLAKKGESVASLKKLNIDYDVYIREIKRYSQYGKKSKFHVLNRYLTLDSKSCKALGQLSAKAWTHVRPHSRNGFENIVYANIKGDAEALQSFIEENFVINHTYQCEHEGQTKYKYGSIGLQKVVDGLFERKKNKRLIPAFIDKMSGENIKDFLYAYWVESGFNKNDSIGFYADNIGFITQIRDLLLSANLVGSIKINHSVTCYKNRVSPLKESERKFSLEFKGQELISAVKEFLKSGKTAKDLEYKDYYFKDGFLYSKISNIEENAYVKEVVGFLVPNGNSFNLLGMSTHNSMMNLGKWRSNVEEQIKIWKRDKNHIAVFPIPMGYQELGGNARALFLTPELKFLEESIINSLGVPIEFIKGGASWTGSSVSLRIVENHFLTYRELLTDFMNHFLVRQVNTHLGYPKVKLRFKKFRMADDTESKQLAMNLNATGKISDSQLLDDFGYDVKESFDAIKESDIFRNDQMIKQQVAQAEGQGQAQVVLARYQARSENAMQKEQNKIKEELFKDELVKENLDVPVTDVSVIIEKYANELAMMDLNSRLMYLGALQKKKPITAGVVTDRLFQLLGPEALAPPAPEPTSSQQNSEPSTKQVKGNADKAHGPTKGSP